MKVCLIAGEKEPGKLYMYMGVQGNKEHGMPNDRELTDGRKM